MFHNYNEIFLFNGNSREHVVCEIVSLYVCVYLHLEFTFKDKCHKDIHITRLDMMVNPKKSDKLIKEQTRARQSALMLTRKTTVLWHVKYTHAHAAALRGKLLLSWESTWEKESECRLKTSKHEKEERANEEQNE